MKTLKPSIKVSMTAAILSATMLSLVAPTHAQLSLTPELQTRAEQTCIDSARTKGFELDQVVSVAPTDADTVQVVLNLTREGQLYKLTCNYSASNNSATVGDDVNNAGAADTSTTAASATQTYTPWINSWWGLLIPLIGLPLLLWWARGRRSDEYDRYTRGDSDRIAYRGRSEGIVRSIDDAISIYAGPSNTHSITGSLRNGQRVALSGRYDSDWVELEDGGWIAARHLETNPRYV